MNNLQPSYCSAPHRAR